MSAPRPPQSQPIAITALILAAAASLLAWPGARIAAMETTPAAAPKPPATRVDDVVDMVQGVRIPDPYRWLEDGGSAEVHAWTEAQNAYTRGLLDSRPGRAAPGS